MRTLVSSAELEDLGEGIVLYYTGGRLQEMRCVDIDGLAMCCLGLRVVYEKFAEEDPDKIGFLADGKTPLRVYRSGKAADVLYGAGTVVLDSYLLRGGMSSRRRFTLAHETAHYILERHNPVQIACFKRELDTRKNCSAAELKEVYSVMDAQADRLAAVLLMPKTAFQSVLAEYTGKKRIPIYGDYTFLPEDKLEMQRAADCMGVSFSAFKNRLRELNLLEHHSLQEYLKYNLKLEGK